MKILAFALFLLSTAGVVGQESITASQQLKEKEEVKTTLLAMWDAIAKGDLNQYAACIHPDFTSFGENDVYLKVGKQLELRGYTDYLKTAKDVHTEMHQPEVTVRGDV